MKCLEDDEVAYCEKFVCRKYRTCLYAPSNTTDCRKICPTHRCDWCMLNGNCGTYNRMKRERKR